MLKESYKKNIEERLGISISIVKESHGKSGFLTYVINDTFILKIYPKSSKNFYRPLFLTLKEKGIPCQPFVDEWSDSDAKYLVLKKIEGIPLSKKKDKDSYYSELGEILKKIHQISVNGFGPIETDGATFPTWKEFLEHFKKYEISHSEIVPSLVSVDHYSLIKKLLVDVSKISFKSGLVHGDFTENNIIVSGDKIVAIIDWDTGIIGDPVMDFSILDIVDQDVINKELLYKSYPESNILKQKEFEYKKDVYFLFSAFITLSKLYKVNRSDINLLPGKIKDVCEKYI